MPHPQTPAFIVLPPPQIVSVPAGAATPAGEARESPGAPGEEEAAICWPCGRNKQLLPPGRGEGVGFVPFHNGAYRREVTCRLTGLRSSGDRADNHAAGSMTHGSSEAVGLEVGALPTFCSGRSSPVGGQDKLGDDSHSSQQESEAQRGPRRQKAGRPRPRPRLRSAERDPGAFHGACALRPLSPLSPARPAWVFKFETCSFSRPNVWTNSERGRGSAQPIAPQRRPGLAPQVTTASRPRRPANGRRHSPSLHGAHVQLLDWGPPETRGSESNVLQAGPLPPARVGD